MVAQTWEKIMEAGKIYFSAKTEVRFTPQEIELLIGQAKRHYDLACREAGTSIAEGGFINGFIARLKLFPTLTPTWSTRELDLAMKVLEINRTPLGVSLFEQLHRLFSDLQTKIALVNGD